MLAGKRPQHSGWLAGKPSPEPANETNSRLGWLKQTLGYTIVEVMIVLAISGVMFLIAVQFINGKQQRAAFTAGVNETANQVQAVIEQVTDGQYSDIPVTCSFNSTAAPPVGGTSFPPGPANPNQGTNSSCTFVGKMIQVCPERTASGVVCGSASSQYSVYTLAGGRIDANDNPIQYLSSFNAPAGTIAADPRVVTALTLSNQALPQGLDVYRLTVTGAPYAFPHAAIINGLSGYIGFSTVNGNLTAGNLSTAAPRVSLYYIYSTGGGHGADYVIQPTDILENSGGTTPIAPAVNADICLTDGTRYAEILLGTNNTDELSVNVKQDGTTAC